MSSPSSHEGMYNVIATTNLRESSPCEYLTTQFPSLVEGSGSCRPESAEPKDSATLLIQKTHTVDLQTRDLSKI
jgi:hypothetical protein